MVRTWALFPKTADSDYFLSKHLTLVEKLFEPEGLLELRVEEGVGIEPPGPPLQYTMLAALTFTSLEAPDRAMTARRRPLFRGRYLTLASATNVTLPSKG